MVRAGEQWNLWDFVGRATSKETEARNKMGPFRLSVDDNVIPRHMDCGNYDACLSYASKHRWPSFGCDGCRRTQHGRFVDEVRRRDK